LEASQILFCQSILLGVEDGLVFQDLIDSPSESNYPGGVSSNNRVRRHILRYDRTGGDYRASPYCDAVKNDGPSADPYVVLNLNTQIVPRPLLFITDIRHEPAKHIRPVIPAANGDLRSKHDVVSDDDCGAGSDENGPVPQLHVVADFDVFERVLPERIKPQAPAMATEPGAQGPGKAAMHPQKPPLP
jgi:hypothetical protein